MRIFDTIVGVNYASHLTGQACPGKTRMPFRQICRWLPALAGLLVLPPQACPVAPADGIGVTEAKVCVRIPPSVAAVSPTAKWQKN